MEKDNKYLFISTLNLPGNVQMALDLHFLDQTIEKPEIILTLRFYYWKEDWLSIGYHQKDIPTNWKKLHKNGLIKIIRRPSGGGAVLHSRGITYALTFKKSSYKSFGYEMVNNWLIKSFKELGVILTKGHTKKTVIEDNCFGTKCVTDLVDEEGYKRVGSAQYRKKGAFLQHGEIQINPQEDLWLSLFGEEAPPKMNLNITNDEIIKHLRSSFLRDYSDLKSKIIYLDDSKIKDFYNKD